MHSNDSYKSVRAKLPDSVDLLQSCSAVITQALPDALERIHTTILCADEVPSADATTHSLGVLIDALAKV